MPNASVRAEAANQPATPTVINGPAKGMSGNNSQEFLRAACPKLTGTSAGPAPIAEDIRRMYEARHKDPLTFS